MLTLLLCHRTLAQKEKVKKLLNLTYVVVEIFPTRQQKMFNSCDFVKGDTCTEALVLRSTTRGNMELGMYEQIEVSRHKKDIENYTLF